MEAHPFFFLNFEGTLSQEEHETIFSDLKITEMALSDQLTPAFFRLHKTTYRNFINSRIDNSLPPLLCKMALAAKF
jgi:hypothetical protein